MNRTDRTGPGGAAELDQRLGALFAAPGLAVAARDGAAEQVLGRVRLRRRRRRAAAVAVPLALAAAALLALGGPAPFRLADPAGPRLPQPTRGTTPPEEARMTGQGVGPARLGMDVGQLRALGLLAEGEPAEEGGARACRTYRGRHGLVGLHVGPGGLYRIDVYAFISTPEGIAVGDSYAEVRRTYPEHLPQTPDRYGYDIPTGTPGTVYSVVFDAAGSAGRPDRDAPVLGLSLGRSTPGACA